MMIHDQCVLYNTCIILICIKKNKNNIILNDCAQTNKRVKIKNVIN